MPASRGCFCSFPIRGRKRGITSGALSRWKCLISSPALCVRAPNFASRRMIPATAYGRWNGFPRIPHLPGSRDRPKIGVRVLPIGHRRATKQRPSPQAASAPICVLSAADSLRRQERFQNRHAVYGGVEDQRQQKRAALGAQPTENDAEQENLADEEPMILH